MSDPSNPYDAPKSNAEHLKISAYPADAKAYVRGIVGAIIGLPLGVLIFWGLLKLGLYAAAVPGVMLGLGCGSLSRIRSVPLAIFCFVASIAACIFTEWWFMQDGSLSFFLENMKMRTKIFVGIGAIFGGWFGYGRDRMMIN